MTNVAIYARISEDQSKRELGVKRQLEDARQLAQQRGWTVVGTYTDNDLSAFSGKVRPEYQRLMEDARRKLFERIVIYQPSRLWRARVERITDMEKLKAAGVGVICVSGPDYDFTTAAGRSMAVMLGESDTMESEYKSERVTRAARQRAEEGRASGQVLFCWKRIYDSIAPKIFHDEIDEPQAAILREAVDRTLHGETLFAICADFNQRQVPTPGGAKVWKHTTLTKLMLRPANIGQRVHHGQVIGKAAWEPILDADTFDRVCVLLHDPSRKRSRDGRRKHLLSFGVGVCGICGGPLSVRFPAMGGTRKRLYRCDGGQRSCVARDADKVDHLVAAVVIARLSQPDAAGLFDADTDDGQAARAKADAVRARLNSAADLFSDGTIDAQQYARNTAQLRPQLEAAEAEVQRNRAPALPANVDGLQGDRASEVWEGLTVTQQRSVMGVLNLSVVVMPRRKSGPGFDPEEIEFRWGS